MHAFPRSGSSVPRRRSLFGTRHLEGADFRVTCRDPLKRCTTADARPFGLRASPRGEDAQVDGRDAAPASPMRKAVLLSPMTGHAERGRLGFEEISMTTVLAVDADPRRVLARRERSPTDAWTSRTSRFQARGPPPPGWHALTWDVEAETIIGLKEGPGQFRMPAPSQLTRGSGLKPLDGGAAISSATLSRT